MDYLKQSAALMNSPCSNLLVVSNLPHVMSPSLGDYFSVSFQANLTTVVKQLQVSLCSPVFSLPDLVILPYVENLRS